MGPGFFGGLFDFNGDGKLDAMERTTDFGMFCEVVNDKEDSGFGDEGSEDDLEDELFMAGLDPLDLEFMDDDERREAIEDAGLDPDDYEDIF